MNHKDPLVSWNVFGLDVVFNLFINYDVDYYSSYCFCHSYYLYTQPQNDQLVNKIS